MTSAAFSHGTIDNAIKQVVTVSLWTKSYGVTTQLNLSAVLSRDAIYLAYSSTFYVYERYLMVLPVKFKSLFSRSICFSIVFYKITFEIKLEF